MKKRILLTFRCFFVTNCMLLVLFQEQIMRNDIGQLFGIMRYHNHGLVFSSAKSRNNLTRQLTITVVQSVQRFIQDKQLRVFDERAGQQTEPLLSAGEFQESTVFQSGDTENVHPPFADGSLFRTRMYVKPYGVVQSAGLSIAGRSFRYARCISGLT